MAKTEMEKEGAQATERAAGPVTPEAAQEGKTEAPEAKEGTTEALETQEAAQEAAQEEAQEGAQEEAQEGAQEADTKTAGTTTETPGSYEADFQNEVFEVQRRFIKDLTLYAKRMRLVFRILAVALIIVMGFLKGPFFSLGVLMGALIVDVNLSIFHYVVRKSDPANPGSPIWVTILKFYLLFAGTALYVFLCIFLHIGEPLGFLVGILCFLPALILTFLWAFINYLRGRARRSKDGAA